MHTFHAWQGIGLGPDWNEERVVGRVVRGALTFHRSSLGLLTNSSPHNGESGRPLHPRSEKFGSVVGQVPNTRLAKGGLS